MTTDLLTTRQATELYCAERAELGYTHAKIKPRTLRAHYYKGHIRGRYLGRQLFFTPCEVRRFARKNYGPGNPVWNRGRRVPRKRRTDNGGRQQRKGEAAG